MNRTLVLKIVLAVVCVSHLVLGSVPQLSAGLVETTGRLAYGATVDLTPQLHHVLRMLGAFMLGIGVLAAFAWKDPVQNRRIIHGIAVILILRAFQRVVFGASIHQAFAVSYPQLWIQGIFFLALGLVLIGLVPRAATSP
jgi:hypothetical protein